MNLLVAVRPGRGCTVLEVAGDLDMATSPQLRDSLQQLVDAGHRQVVVDLSGVGFMDSSALGALVVMFKAFRDLGGRLCVAAVQPAVRSVLTITSVDQVLRVYDSVQAAEDDVPTEDGTARG
ncbi:MULTISPECIES: STAS domain-containing protein [unclassified Plantactinospora]|uniref:STAS domain-containing protein n=1 Tax=unclassified Plantactinospora TaxID=2631981 RepID=UPI000D15E869|nr:MULTISPECIES: STAS domain-containing protein [unclassified Plantactinospora]AVT29289.1 anti-sigma factor antagonist [Plantactinospora sp. BC1]AVT35703.1 anti-sigma factor antagonist [Plantactinospora sp. BB1]